MQEFNLSRGTEKELLIAERCGIEPEMVAMIALTAIGVVRYERQIPYLPAPIIHRIHDIFEDSVCKKQQVLTEEKLLGIAVDIAIREMPCPIARGLQTLCTSGDSGSSARHSKANISKGHSPAIKTDSRSKGIDQFNQQSSATSNDSNSGELL